MCGIAGIVGRGWRPDQLDSMIGSQRHRGPDACGIYLDPSGVAGLGHNRLSILDLSSVGTQPMVGSDRHRWIVFNGEIFNYLELKAELHDYDYRSATDTEVILAAYDRWGTACVDHFIGMFAFLIWDERERRLFAARDRFGVKPLLYHRMADGSLMFASEIRALHAAGVAAIPDAAMWATYLSYGFSDHTEGTFWAGISSLGPGCALTWQDHRTRIWPWYDLAEKSGQEYDSRPTDVVQEEYLALLKDSLRLRFRADVPVGINLSGGLDSSTLLGLVQSVQGADNDVTAFTFATGDARYDEIPWVEQMLERTHHPLRVCRLDSTDVPEMAASVQLHQDEPFGGLPTLAYARLFECAREQGVKVLLDGQGMDEQWAGYDYYLNKVGSPSLAVVQGMKDRPVRPECLMPDFQAAAQPFEPPRPFPDALRNAQYRDARYTKIPKVLRFNDRVSMRSSTELREPFLDHRVFELALRQPPERKIHGDEQKWLLRRTTQSLLPQNIVSAPKRPLQTPQREWLAGTLRWWATDMIEHGLAAHGGSWLDARAVRAAFARYCLGEADNSFYIWQWISLGLLATTKPAAPALAPALRAGDQ
jgi:asparagine synthase (glutamine-hydrolysing)